ncbi:MAG: 50S ribosomal protein L24 [Polyangiaceae bacterium]
MQRLKVGDLVQVISGKDKGKRGKVTKLLKKEDRVVVEGLNMVVRHQRPNQRNTEGGRIEMEAPLHVSKVMPIDADSDKPTRVKVVTDEDGKKSRVAKSGAALKQG